MEIFDSKYKALEIHMKMIIRNEHLPFAERKKKSKMDALEFANKKQKESKLFEEIINWDAVIKQIEKL